MYNEIYRQGGTFMESYKNITAQEAKIMMEEQKVMVVDVREPDEYAEGHVPGAILIPLGTIGNGRPEKSSGYQCTNTDLLSKWGKKC